MKVQIYGARMSGSFLYILLRDHLKVKITNRRSKHHANVHGRSSITRIGGLQHDRS